MKKLMVLMTIFCCVGANAHEEPEGAPNIGATKGVTEFDKHLGFKISEKAEKTLGIKYRKLQGGAPWLVGPESIVHLKNDTGIYRRSKGWISFVVVETEQKPGSQRTISSKDLRPGDEVVIHGTVFLRMIDSDLNTGKEDNDDDAHEKEEEP